VAAPVGVRVGIVCRSGDCPGLAHPTRPSAPSTTAPASSSTSTHLEELCIPIVHRPSSIVHRPSSIVSRQSSIVYRQPSTLANASPTTVSSPVAGSTKFPVG
jgi:hypothetical protein